MPTTLKDDRLQIRVGQEGKHLLEEAAAAVHLSVSSFVLQAALLAAEDALAERSHIGLSPEAARAFQEALLRPAAVNDRLGSALARPRSFAWLD